MIEGLSALVSFHTAKWIEEVKASYKADKKMVDLILKLESQQKVPKEYFLQHAYTQKGMNCVGA